jgi:hypothetical protein
MPNNSGLFYFISDTYCICDTTMCSASDRTFDISLFDLANNERLLNVLNLVYLKSSYLIPYTHESRAKWFYCYLSAFSHGNNEQEKCDKMQTNPLVRILITDFELLQKCLTIIHNASTKTLDRKQHHS